MYQQQNSGFVTLNYSKKFAEKPKNTGDTKHFRFVGNPFKYKIHNDFGKQITKICINTLNVRYEPTIDAEGNTVMGEHVYYRIDEAGNKAPYGVNDYMCSCCQDEMTPRNNWAINVIDLDEEAEAIKRGDVPELKILEMTKTVHEQLKEFFEETRIHPQDVSRGPAFEMKAYMIETGAKPQPKDKRYKMIPMGNDKTGSAYALPDTWCIAFFEGVNGKPRKLIDLAEQYHPLKQSEKMSALVKSESAAASAPSQSHGYSAPPQQQVQAQNYSAPQSQQITIPPNQPVQAAPVAAPEANSYSPPTSVASAPATPPAGMTTPAQPPIQASANTPPPANYSVSQSEVDDQIAKLML